MAADRPATTISPALPAPPPINSEERPNTSAPPNLKAIAPGVFDLNGVTLDQNRREVRFHATVNGKTSQGPQEYLLVTGYGKTHESILSTEASPQMVHLAMLLLGAKGTAAVGQGGAALATNTPIHDPGSEKLAGNPVELQVSWTAGGNTVRRNVESLVMNAKTKAALGAGNWVYNGSTFEGGRFSAQANGQVVSLVTDATALVNYVGAGHEDDTLWLLNPDRMPPAGAALEVSIRLPGKESK